MEMPDLAVEVTENRIPAEEVEEGIVLQNQLEQPENQGVSP
jgi:hypothetical protein